MGLPLMPAMTPVFSRSRPDSRHRTMSRPGLVFLRTPRTSASKVSTLVPFMTVRPTPFMPAWTSSTCQYASGLGAAAAGKAASQTGRKSRRRGRRRRSARGFSWPRLHTRRRGEKGRAARAGRQVQSERAARFARRIYIKRRIKNKASSDGPRLLASFPTSSPTSHAPFNESTAAGNTLRQRMPSASSRVPPTWSRHGPS